MFKDCLGGKGKFEASQGKLMRLCLKIKRKRIGAAVRWCTGTYSLKTLKHCSTST